jgi:hypothetical protein
MNDMDTGVRPRGGRLRIPRSRGAASGFLLIVLGAWGALIPFIGPYFDFAYTPDQAWMWTSARGWLEVLPGAATVVGGLLLLSSRNRATAMLGGWVTVIAGAWFVVGELFAGMLNIGDIGTPVASTDAKRALLELTYFFGLGALIIFLGAVALGRLSVRSLRDISYARRPVGATERQPEPVAEARAGQHAAPVVEPEVEPEGEPEAEPERRSWSQLFGRRRRTTTTATR